MVGTEQCEHYTLEVQVGWDAGDTCTEAGADVGALWPGDVLSTVGTSCCDPALGSSRGQSPAGWQATAGDHIRSPGAACGVGSVSRWREDNTSQPCEQS